jgi:RhtB (resistance to homoserine/threonine) family protein
MGIHLWAFLGISLVVILSPGPDTVLVTKNALIHGRRAALGTSLGVSTGLLIWTVTAAVGIAAIVRSSGVAFTTLKLVGAVYLLWLGFQALRAARARAGLELTAGSASGAKPAGIGLGFRQGVANDLANPKIAVFFTSLLPQFVSGHNATAVPFLLLGSLFVVITFIWLSSYALLATRLAEQLVKPRIKAILDGIAGVVLIGFGVKLALERR